MIGFGDVVALVTPLAAFDEAATVDVGALDELTEPVVLFPGLTDEEDEKTTIEENGVDALDMVEVVVVLVGLVEVRIVVDRATVTEVEVDVEVVRGLDVYEGSLVGSMGSRVGDDMRRGEERAYGSGSLGQGTSSKGDCSASIISQVWKRG